MDVFNNTEVPEDLKEWQTHEQWATDVAKMEQEMRDAATKMNLKEEPREEAIMEEEGLKFMDATDQNFEA